VTVERERVHAGTRQNPASGPVDREQVHDYRARYFGHDYAFSPVPGTGGVEGTAFGWGVGITTGDILIFLGPNGGGSLYRVESIRYEADPPDMWWAKLRYARGALDYLDA
jgi:hypothetical protein